MRHAHLTDSPAGPAHDPAHDPAHGRADGHSHGHPEGHPHGHVPRSALIAAGLVVLATILLSAGASSGLIARFETPTATAVEGRLLTVHDQAGGRVLIRDAETGAEIATLATGEENFIRGVLRGFARERRMHNVGAGPAFQLTHWSDGRLTIRDTATERLVDLGSFGPDNIGAFARFLKQSGGGA